jgi:hypothetical protein
LVGSVDFYQEDWEKQNTSNQKLINI